MNIKILVLTIVASASCLYARPRNERAHLQKNPIFLASMPKCGSFLIKQCLERISPTRLRYTSRSFFNAIETDFKSRSSLFSHAPYNPQLAALIEKNNYKGILMIRDPRDQAISFIHFAQNSVKIWPVFKTLSFNDAVTLWINDTKTIKGQGKFSDPIIDTFGTIADYYDHYLHWVDHPNFYTVRFEHLVGAQGGGSNELQRQEIINIANHLEIEPTDELIEKTIHNLFGRSRTFRKGQIGSWKSQFTPEHKKLFKEVAGDLLIQLGYEEDYDW